MGDMIASGCMLAIADDASVLPFAETLRWSAFSLRLPENSPAALPAALDALTDGQLDLMLRKWRAARPKLLFEQAAATEIAAGLMLREPQACAPFHRVRLPPCPRPVKTPCPLSPVACPPAPTPRRYAARCNARQAACLDALASSPGPFAIDADAAAMSAEQRVACHRQMHRRAHGALGAG